MNILIKNATVITMDAADRILPGTCVAVSAGRITHVGEESALPVGFRADKVIDARGGAVMPGFVNAHTHLSMTLLRGYGNDLNLQDWLEKKVWPAEDKLQPGWCYWGAMLGLAEMIRGGTTAFLDMYFFMEEIAQAVEQTGMRAVLSRGMVGRAPNFPKALAEAEALHRDYHGAADGRIGVMLAPHAEYTNDENSIRSILEVANKLDCGIHVHVQETVAETRSCFERYGMSPSAWFEKLGVFDRHTVAAHCVTVTEEDQAILKRHGVFVAHNPGSNMKLASGIAPVERMRTGGVCVALGTDGASSNNNLDMLEEVRLAALLAKTRECEPTAMPAYEALKLATINGAKALGIDTVTGSIEIGKDADIILFDTKSPALHPPTDVVANIVYSAGAGDVATTIVKGRVLMEDRVLLGMDLEKIYTEADKISAAMCG